jgi:hypothetical protein
MKVRNVLTKRGRALIAGAGIAVAIAVNGLGGGSASAAELQPAPATGCATLPAEQDQTTLEPGAGVAGTSTSPATGSAGMPETSQVQQQEPGSECAAQRIERTSPTVSVEICVTPGGTVIQSVPAAGVPATGQSGITTGSTAEASNGGATAAQGSDSSSATGGPTAAESTGQLTVSQGADAETGVSGGAGATCISVSVAGGQPAVGFSTAPNAALQPATGTQPDSGAPETGETLPAQPGGDGGLQAQPGTLPQPTQ